MYPILFAVKLKLDIIRIVCLGLNHSLDMYLLILVLTDHQKAIEQPHTHIHTAALDT